MAECLYYGDKPIGLIQSNAEDIEYSTGVSVKEKIEDIEAEVATKIVLKTVTGTVTTNSNGVVSFTGLVADRRILRVDVTGVQADIFCILGTWGGSVLGYFYTRDLNPVSNTQLSVRILYYDNQ